MRKNYVLLKRYVLALTLLLTTTIIIYSCKKEIKKPTDAELITQAKEWFNAQSVIFYTPSWEKAIVAHTNNQNFIVLPSNISLTDGRTMVKSLLVINVFENRNQGNLIEVFDEVNVDDKLLKNVILPEYLTYNEKAIFSKDVKFNLLLFDIEHKFQKGSAFVDGSIRWSLSLMAPTDLKSSERLMNLRPKTLMADRNRTTKEKACYDYYLVYRDLMGALIESYYLYSSCDDGGGNVGGSGGSNSNSKSDIRNNVKNQCIKNALNLALSKNAVNEIKTLFYDAFGSNKNYNVVFADGSFNTTTKDATTSTGLDPRTSVMTSLITFNTDVSVIRSEQYAVATIYHEMVHAELRKLFPQDADGKIIIPSQHEYMAQNFVNKIEASIKSVFPDLSDADAQALSWGGLKQTSFFDLLTDANKTLIGETLMKYSDKDRYDKLGTYCN